MCCLIIRIIHHHSNKVQKVLSSEILSFSSVNYSIFSNKVYAVNYAFTDLVIVLVLVLSLKLYCSDIKKVEMLSNALLSLSVIQSFPGHYKD